MVSGNTTLKLADAAANTQERIISAELLRYFDKDFPKHPNTTTALLRAVEILIADAKDIAGAQKLLAYTRIKYPEAAKSDAFQRLQKAAL